MTPLSVGLPVGISVAPSLSVMVPPSIRLLKFHEPVEAFRVRLRLSLFSVPVRLTVPPLRLYVPVGVVKVPPRFRVPLLTSIRYHWATFCVGLTETW